MITVAPHPLLCLAAFETEFVRDMGQLPSPPWLTALLALDAEAPLQRDEATRASVRDLLRHGGYKPTGRGKPASEYLVRAAGAGQLGSINLAVDACNVVSLHSGLPISVVDSGSLHPPLSVGLGAADDEYAFNASGQTIGLKGLLCLFDAQGPCANAVKDSQRTKTHAGTRATLSLVWGPVGLAQRVDEACGWYRQLLERAGAHTRSTDCRPKR